ncbi:hypothetical protein F6R98_21250 [Candidatus Methylospira mobilis]|uniref:Uncharacterized protein n=1 Tax=Candidatus Methylospira mobilis TaxID=1808979 RepID=A0A5Q0BT55_9GAMM|nr:hypothetical protein [Candidatus Methylospira mobilis]QFY44846.1 hypothetical protein F6R98_21250 [Candidatus Methylospira mobilis]
MRCRQVIDDKQKLSETELEQLWELGVRLLDLDFDEIFDKDQLVYEQDVACGLIAVAVCKFRGWLNFNANQEPDCINYLVETVLTPPPGRKFDMAENIMDTWWDSFCADALPILWAENPDTPVIRQAIGTLIFNLHYNTVQRLFHEIAGLRLQLGEDFFRLQHMLLRWSVLRHRLGRLGGKEKSASEELAEETNVLLRKFVDASLSPTIPRWITIDHTFVDHRSSLNVTDEFDRQTYYPRPPGIDLHLIQSAHDWLPDLNNAHSETERLQWLEFWQQCIYTVQWMLGEGKSEIEKIDGTPYQFDRWLFKKLPVILVSTKTAQEAESLWCPILTLGAPAHYWIDDFLSDWWNYGFSSDTQGQQRFISVWKEIWAFTQTSPAWNNAAKRAWDMDKSYCSLMGLGELTLSDGFWSTDKKHLVKAMTDEFRLWCEAKLPANTCARAFIKFLTKPVAESLRIPGIKWLDQTIAQHGFWRNSCDEIDTHMADLLDISQELVKQGTETRTIYFRLLRMLVEHQNPQAMALQERLGG